jgi:hypothetical protein
MKEEKKATSVRKGLNEQGGDSLSVDTKHE